MEGPPPSGAANLSSLFTGTLCSPLSSGNTKGNFFLLGFTHTGPSVWGCPCITLHPLNVSPGVLFCGKVSSPLWFLSPLYFSAC